MVLVYISTCTTIVTGNSSPSPDPTKTPPLQPTGIEPQLSTTAPSSCAGEENSWYIPFIIGALFGGLLTCLPVWYAHVHHNEHLQDVKDAKMEEVSRKIVTTLQADAEKARNEWGGGGGREGRRTAPGRAKLKRMNTVDTAIQVQRRSSRSALTKINKIKLTQN